MYNYVAFKSFERNHDRYIFQGNTRIKKPAVGVNDFKSIKNRTERKEFLKLTIDILEGVSEGKVKESKLKKISSLVEKYNLSLDIDSLLKPSGYIIYTLNGLKTYENPRLQQSLIKDIISFTKESELLKEIFYSSGSRKVLDYGCGVGWFGYLLNKNFGIETFGLDVDENAIKIGSFFDIENIYYPIKLETQDDFSYLFKLPYINEVFDMVVSKSALFEAPSKGMASFIGDDLRIFHHNINEVERVLKQNRVLFVETNLNKEAMLSLLKNHKLVLNRVLYSKSTDKEWKLFVKKE